MEIRMTPPEAHLFKASMSRRRFLKGVLALPFTLPRESLMKPTNATRSIVSSEIGGIIGLIAGARLGYRKPNPPNSESLEADVRLIGSGMAGAAVGALIGYVAGESLSNVSSRNDRTPLLENTRIYYLAPR